MNLGISLALTRLSNAIRALLTSPTPQAYGTWTDARTDEIWLPDHEAILRSIPSGELPYTGNRVVKNLITGSSEDLTHANWAAASGATVDDFNTISFSATLNSRVDLTQLTIAKPSATYIVSALVWVDSGVEAVRLKCTHVAVADYYSSDLVVTTTPTRVSFTKTFTSSTNPNLIVGIVSQSGGGSVYTVHATDIQLENVTGQAYQNSSEYVSVGVDG